MNAESILLLAEDPLTKARRELLRLGDTFQSPDEPGFKILMRAYDHLAGITSMYAPTSTVADWWESQ